MPLLIVAIAVALLLILMTKYKLNGFVALLIVSVLVAGWGALSGVLTVDDKPADVSDIPDIIGSGMGGQLEETLAVIGIGAMIGRILGDAGAAQRIALKVVGALGEKRVQWAMIATAMLIGVTMFYDAFLPAPAPGPDGGSEHLPGFTWSRLALRTLHRRPRRCHHRDGLAAAVLRQENRPGDPPWARVREVLHGG